jgi:hypothetical protein
MAPPEIDGSRCCADQLLLRAGTAASDLAHCLDGQVFDDCAGLIKLASMARRADYVGSTDFAMISGGAESRYTRNALRCC